MTFSKLSLLPAVGALAFAGGADAALIAEAGGADLGSAQVIAATGNDTITGGVSGDAVHIGSGTVSIVGGARVQVSLAGGTPNGQYTLATAPSDFTQLDATARQYSDGTFTTEVFFDDDDGPGNYSEFVPGDGVTFGADGSLHLEFGEFGDDGDITYGYDVLDITQATRNDDWFRITGLVAGSTATITLVSDGASFGFFDGLFDVQDSGGVSIGGADDVVLGTAGFPNRYFGTADVIVPGDGVLILQVGPFGGAARSGGTYEVQIDGVVPEPGSLALLGLGGLALIRRRRA